MANWQIECKDVLKWCAEYDGPKFHAILCDPPYGLEFMGKQWDAPWKCKFSKHGYTDGGQRRAAPTSVSSRNPMCRKCHRHKRGWKGHPGCECEKPDFDDLEHQQKDAQLLHDWYQVMFEALSEHLLPGAFIFVFGSSRGWHRLAVAIEDAGFVFHPSLMVWGWVQAAGFPKSTRIERSFVSDNSPFCQCDDSPPLSPERDSQCNAHDGMSKAADSQLSCPQDCRQDDEQPRLVLASVQDGEPLQGDAQEHNHSDGPLVENREDSEPLCSPCQVQCSAPQRIDNAQDWQELSDDASQLLQENEDETYRESDSSQPSKALSKSAQDSFSIGKGGDRLASHRSNIGNSDNVLPSGSLDTPFSETCSHYTTDGPRCQVCGKVKRGIWEGHRYGRQAMKPSVEMLICAQKPYEGRPVDSIVETGAGALFIDGGRVGVNDSEPNFRGNRGLGRSSGGFQQPYIGGSDKKPIEDYHQHSGRWPPNFCLVHVPPHICATCDGDGCDECNDMGLVGGCRRVGTKQVKGSHPTGLGNEVKEFPETGCWFGGTSWSGGPTDYTDADGLETVAAWQCVEECAARRIGEQSGDKMHGAGFAMQRTDKRTTRPPGEHCYRGENNELARYGDKGTAARFFPQFGWAAEIAERLANSDQVRYCAKASRGERDTGLNGEPVQRHAVSNFGVRTRTCNICGCRTKPPGIEYQTEDWPTCGHNDWSLQENLPTGVKGGNARNSHPCVKPIALCRWLATLLLPPPEYAPRRILIPFSGVSSEGIGALFAGFDEIVMIEQDAEYCKIGEARMQFWSQFDSHEEAMRTARQFRRAQKTREEEKENGQLELW